jgi:hypothetical protein
MKWLGLTVLSSTSVRIATLNTVQSTIRRPKLTVADNVSTTRSAIREIVTMEYAEVSHREKSALSMKSVILA